MKAFSTPGVDRSGGGSSRVQQGIDTPSVNAFLKKLEDNAPEVEINETKQVEFNVLRFGNSISLAALSGICLSMSFASPMTRFNAFRQKDALELTGSGIGATNESIIIASPQEKLKGSPIHYSDTVLLKFDCNGVEKYIGSQVLQQEEVDVTITKVLASRDEEWRILNEENMSDTSHVHSGHRVVLLHESSNRFLSYRRKMGEIEPTTVTSEPNDDFNNFCIVTTFSRNPQFTSWTITSSSVPKFPSKLWVRPYNGFGFLNDETRKISQKSDKRFHSNTIATGFEPEIDIYQTTCGPNEHNYDRIVKSLNTFPLPVQEEMMIDDLLNAMLGFESRYIRAMMSDCVDGVDVRQFEFCPSSSSSSTWTSSNISPDLINQILSICNDHIIIASIASSRSRFDFGLVSHALSSALTTILSQYDLLVSQIDVACEKKTMSLQGVWCMLAPTSGPLKALAKFLSSITTASQQQQHWPIGGCLLSLIYTEKQRHGNAQITKMFEFLFESMSVPYLRMLTNWTKRGVIDDVYNEFMIKLDRNQSQASLVSDFSQKYWNNRYQLRQENIVQMLQPYAQKILLTGKYWNTLLECQLSSNASSSNDNNTIDSRNDDDVCCPTWSLTQIESYINSSYQKASKGLLDYFVNSCNLYAHFSSLKHFFFLDHVDFLSNFLEAAEDELNMPVEKLSLARIDSLFQSSMQSSSISGDANRDCVKCKFAPFSVLQHLSMIHFKSLSNVDKQADAASVNRPLKGVEAVMLEYAVDWPMSIVLSRRVLAKYQLLFRMLFFAKHVERRLSECWKYCQEMRSLVELSLLQSSICHQNLALVTGLTHQMLHFLQNFLFYVMFEVIEPRWLNMNESIRTCQSIDQVCDKHEEFLDCCLRDCLLSSQNHLMYLIKIMMTCLMFSERVSTLVSARSDGDSSVLGQRLDLSFEKEMTDTIQAEIDRLVAAIPSGERNAETVLHAAYQARYQFRSNVTRSKSEVIISELSSSVAYVVCLIFDRNLSQAQERCFKSLTS